MSLTESRAIQAVQQGNREAFGVLYDLYVRPIYRFISIKTQHRSTAEDLVSQTFLKALERINTFDSTKGTFAAWLYKIARNTVIDYYRTERSVTSIDDAWDIPEVSTVEHDTDIALAMNDVRSYLSQLSSSEREILLMRVWGEASYSEIAAALGKSEASCKMMYTRTIKKLRQMMPISLYLLFLLSRLSL